MKSFKKFINKRRQSFQKQNKAETTPAPPASTPATANVNNEKRVAAPAEDNQQQQVLAEAAPGTLQLALQNKSNSGNVYAYITGLALEKNNTPIFIQADGRSVYYPVAPSEIQQPLQADVAIPLGAPGNTVNVNIPKIAGGRIWFSMDAKLTFLLNPGPAVVEPSVTNPADPNYNINWTFCEFTYNDAQLFANISYVDFVSIPVALSLTNTQGNTQSVPGMGPDGFQTLINELRAQAQRDGRPWDKLIYESNGQPLRVISPNNLLVGNGAAWDGYWDAYTNAVWDKYRNEDMTINTQLQPATSLAACKATSLNLAKRAPSLPLLRATSSHVLPAPSPRDRIKRATPSFHVLQLRSIAARC
jgi:hypothetical protein